MVRTTLLAVGGVSPTRRTALFRQPGAVLGATFGRVRGAGALAAVALTRVPRIGLSTLSRTVDLFFLPPHGQGHEVDHLPVANGTGEGVPVFPGSRIEQVGLLDAGCVVAELVVVGCVLALLPPPLRARVSTVAVVVAAGLVVAGGVSLVR